MINALMEESKEAVGRGKGDRRGRGDFPKEVLERIPDHCRHIK